MDLISGRTTVFFIAPALLLWLNPLTTLFQRSKTAYDIDLHVPDFLTLIKSHGRDAELYNVTTEDGYVLSLFRLPPNPVYYNSTYRKGVIFLQHPLMASAAIYIVFGPGRSLAHSLSDAGYDVWMGNFRGNTYARRHTTLSPDDPEFWNYSIDDCALRDLPVLIDYVVEATNTSSVSYVGHSLATTTILMLLSERPEYNSKFSSLVLLAPISYWTVQNPSRTFLLYLARISKFLVPVNTVEMQPQNGVLPRLLQNYCFQHSFLRDVCYYPIGLITGDNPEQFGWETWDFWTHYPAGISLKALHHYGQHIKFGTLHRFDYESKELNFKHYGTYEPPEYSIANITSPVVLIYGQNDPLATIEDIQVLAKKLSSSTKLIHHIIEDEKFNHGDFVLNLNAERLVYKNVIEIVSQFH